MDNNKLEQIRKEREAKYGPAKQNMETMGKAFTAVLEQHYRIKLDHPIPAHVMCMLMVTIKTVRSVAPEGFTEDNYDDAHNYIIMARECLDPTEKKIGPKKPVTDYNHPCFDDDPKGGA